jgi:TRAP-type mannitol/chloroaromatic compound transport system permease large subunit
MQNNNQLAIIALVAALALLGVVVGTVLVTIPLQQEAEARGCKTSIAFNASQGRCFHP